MKISAYIEELRKRLEEHGDIEVEQNLFDGTRVEARAPSIAYKMILQGREHKERFWYNYIENSAARKGEKVCQIG